MPGDLHLGDVGSRRWSLGKGRLGTTMEWTRETLSDLGTLMVCGAVLVIPAAVYWWLVKRVAAAGKRRRLEGETEEPASTAIIRTNDTAKSVDSDLECVDDIKTIHDESILAEIAANDPLQQRRECAAERLAAKQAADAARRDAAKGKAAPARGFRWGRAIMYGFLAAVVVIAKTYYFSLKNNLTGYRPDPVAMCLVIIGIPLAAFLYGGLKDRWGE